MWDAPKKKISTKFKQNAFVGGIAKKNYMWSEAEAEPLKSISSASLPANNENTFQDFFKNFCLLYILSIAEVRPQVKRLKIAGSLKSVNAS